MSGYVYAARSAATAYSGSAALTINLSGGGFIDPATQTLDVTATVSDGVKEGLSLPRVRITATLDGAECKVKLSSDSGWSSFVYMGGIAANGDDYEGTDTIWFQVLAADSGKTLQVTATVTTVTPNLTSSDTSTVI